jgi:cold shock protein
MVSSCSVDCDAVLVRPGFCLAVVCRGTFRPLLHTSLAYGEELRLMTGVIKFFNDSRGFGFIQPETGEDVFIHISALPETDGPRTLSEGQRVQFEIVQERGRARAANVVLLT